METNANDAYRAAREKLYQALNRLNHLVRVHDARQFRDRKDWGYVGNVEHVIEVVNEALAFLGGEGVAR